MKFSMHTSDYYSQELGSDKCKIVNFQWHINSNKNISHTDPKNGSVKKQSNVIILNKIIMIFQPFR